MGKYNGFKNRMEKFFSSDQGQRVFNFAYSFGASIVILGALFKLLHLPMADLALCIGMGTEALIFGLSAFDKPAKDYHWENVFPTLKRDDYTEGADLAEIARNLQDLSNAPRSNVYTGHAAVSSGSPVANSSMPTSSVAGSSDDSYGRGIPSGEAGYAHQPVQMQTEVCTSPIPTTPELADATEQYIQQMTAMTEQLARLKEITGSLAEVSNTLLDSYSSITENSDNLQSHSAGYVQQMETLNRNISGLNTIYEIQLKSVSSQLDTIDKVNTGLSNIRTMYENSTMDSFKIRQETDKMSENLAQLNKIYERMLAAMTVNMQNPVH